MKNRYLFIPFALITLLLLSMATTPVPKKSKVITVGFYNVENLFDLEDDPKTNDNEFLPDGSYHWTKENYKTKLDNLSRVISEMGDEDGPEILGLCEVENRKVLEDLVKNPLLKKKGYKILHADSPDKRGIDCALIYKKKAFLPLYTKSYTVNLKDKNPDLTTRDVFLVKGLLDEKEEVTFLVNHWSSRRGGPEKSNWKRERAAEVVRHVLDSIQELDPEASVVVMGDFNDEPQNSSILEVLKAAKNPLEARYTGLFNTMAKLKFDGEGSLKYKSRWDMFDQFMVTAPMLKENALLHYIDCSAAIYNPKWMRVESGDWKDAPKRSHISRKFHKDGYSDHFPVYIRLEYEK